MPSLEQTIRRWLRECKLETSEPKLPNMAFAVGFKFPTGLQLIAAQPEGRPDMVVLSCGIGIDAPSREAIAERAADYTWNLRRDLLLAKLGFALNPPDEAVPETITLSDELYQDGLDKNTFLRAARDVHSGAVLVILTTRKYVDAAGPSS